VIQRSLAEELADSTGTEFAQPRLGSNPHGSKSMNRDTSTVVHAAEVVERELDRLRAARLYSYSLIERNRTGDPASTHFRHSTPITVTI
jgi:hypothetical protein